jgi:hypothetical protein
MFGFQSKKRRVGLAKNGKDDIINASLEARR